jgi:uncharacterized protein (TIGR04255 family)
MNSGGNDLHQQAVDREIEMTRTYQKPPISEAICEFRFSESTQWDITIPGLLYGKLQSLFPFKEQRIFKNFQIVERPNGPEQIITDMERVLFFSEDRRSVVFVGQNFLSVNVLPPYPGWNKYFPLIQNVFQTYSELVNDLSFDRIGLRYVNTITLPESFSKVSDYFDFYPHIGLNLPQNMIGFMTGCIFPFNKGHDACKVEISNVVPSNPTSNPDTKVVLLDLDYFLSARESVSTAEIINWLEVAHRNIEMVFEGCIKDPIRETLSEVDQGG